MKIPQWLKRKQTAAPGKPAPEPETVEQAAARLEQARSDLAVAERQVAEARVKLDEERDDAALEALGTAKKTAENLAELVKLVEHDLEAAHARAEASRRAQLEKELEEVRGKINIRNEAEKSLRDAELAAWLAVLDARAALHQHQEGTQLISGQMSQVHKALGLGGISSGRDRGQEDRLWNIEIAEAVDAYQTRASGLDLKTAIARMLFPNIHYGPRARAQE